MTTTRWAVRAAACFATLALAGCQCGEPCNPEIDDNCEFDAGAPPEDFCDTPMAGLSDTTHCVLQLQCGIDGGRTAFINPPDGGMIDQDWYSASFGALNARSLLRVSAGYTAPATPVDLAVTILRENASMSLARLVDDHGQGAPRPIDILMPYTESNSKLLFLVSDRGGRPPVFDVRNRYFISVCTQENPDMNEPNDAADGGTLIPLMQAGAVLSGTNSGYIATDNDVDRFKVIVPNAMPGPRNLIYVRVTTAMALTPPPPYRLAFTLLDPSGVPVAEQVTPNAFLQADLSTARLIRTPGTYTVVVQGYKANPNDPALVPGDLRQQYTVSVQVMEDLDTLEPNDSMAEAAPRARTLSPGNTVTLTGRLSYLPDPEFFAFDLPSTGSHSTLYARLTQSTTAGRFAPLAGPKDRQLRIIAAVPGQNPATSINNCLNDAMLCPKGYNAGDVGLQNLVARTCTGFADAGAGQCLWLERNQNNDSPNFADLRNMQGSIPVAPHAGGAVRYWVIVQDDGSNYADDVEWTLTVSLQDDPDEARFNGGPVAASIPGTVNGVLTYGYGRTVEHDLQRCAAMPANRCEGIRSPYDYDAVATDFDQFTFTLGAGMDRSWGLQWDIDKVDGGTLPAELVFDLAFCSGTTCERTSTAYVSGNFQPWYGTALTDRVFGWTRQDMGSFVRVSANLQQCLCLKSSLTQLQMSVGVGDREWYGPLTYRVTQTAGAYSGTFAPADGGSRTCGPAPMDGGIAPCRLP